jgi:signal transduction histidine kinase
MRRLSGLSIESLLWVTGLFCGFAGAFLLVAPHHFQSGPYDALLPYGLLWGTLALASGVGLLAVAVLRPRQPWQGLCVHVLAGMTLLALAASFGRVGAITGAIAYSILGLGTMIAGLRTRGSGGGDLFGFLMGTLATLVGVLILTFPQLFKGSLYDSFRTYLPFLGLALFLTGPFLVYAQLAPGLKRWQLWLAHAAAGATFIVFGLLVSLPRQTWTGVALYGGGGAVIALLPWVRGRLSALDTAALRTRLALVLAVSTSLGLILATAVATAQEERLAADQAVATQKIEARAIAQNVADYLSMNGARVFALAALAGQLPMDSENQGELLATARKTYADMSAFRTVAADGRVIAANGEANLPPNLLQDLIEDMMTRRQARVRLIPARVGQPLSILLWAPVHNSEASLQGLLVAELDFESLARRIARPGSTVTLADGSGRKIASHSEPLAGEKIPELPAGWDRRIRSRLTVERAGAVAGFAVVPVRNWVVAVERPRSDALAGVRRGRDLAFGLLLLVIPLAVIGGIIAARRIARPLGDLSEAVDELTAGNLAAPIGATSGITEVARLAAAFQEMRDRLAERTHESERLATELRARVEALAETDRRKDEFLAMLAHELRNPLGAIANASYLLEQLGSASPTMERSVAIIRRQIQHLVRMVDDLLDVSRITRGKAELRREPLDLVEVVRLAVESCRPLAEAKEHRLLVELHAEPLPLDGDATRLEQVLSNLLRNAIKFTDPGGIIQISVRRESGVAVVRVRDNGVGIAPDLLPRVFDLFAQGEQALDRAEAGLGIGLTLVRSLVEMHGGRVQARSEGRGMGSELEVRLPLSSAAA